MKKEISLIAPVECAKQLIQKALTLRATQKRFFIQLKAALGLAKERGFKHEKDLLRAYQDQTDESRITRLTKRLLAYISIDEMLQFSNGQH